MSNYQMTNISEPSVYNASNYNGNNVSNVTIGSLPPALPPRPHQMQRYGGWANSGLYGSGYGNYGYSNYNGYGGYGSYSQFGPSYGMGYGGMYGGYNRMGLFGSNNLENR